MIIHQCVQGSTEWHELHRGIPSAGSFDRIITAKSRRLAAASKEYINELIAQTLGAPMGEGYTSPAAQEGKDREAESRAWVGMELNLILEQVGFITTDDRRFGCSPDALIRCSQDHTPSAGLELKNPAHKTQVKYLLAGGLPPEYAAQVHGGMLVTGLDEWWFCSYAPPLPTLLVKVVRDNYTAALRVILEEFYDAYNKSLNLIRNWSPTLHLPELPPQPLNEEAISMAQSYDEMGGEAWLEKQMAAAEKELAAAERRTRSGDGWNK